MSLPGRTLLSIFAGFVLLLPARAVEDTAYPGGYDTTPPSDSSVDGWDYVGQIGTASGVYLGGGWVLTAGHVVALGLADFTLNNVSYDPVPGSAHNISNDGTDTSIDSSLAGETADLTLFQIMGNPTLPPLPSLTLTLTQPEAPGASVLMIGYGGNQGETWGQNTVTETNDPTSVDGYSYLSLDFVTQTGSDGLITNTAELVGGDSGGGDFIYNSVTQKWELAGINEGYGSQDGGPDSSFMVQLSDYDAQIEGIMAVPEPSTRLLFWSGLAAFGVWTCCRRRRAI